MTKTFADYVSSAYQRASQRASHSGAATSPAPVRTRPSMARALQPSSSSSSSGDGVDQFLDAMEQVRRVCVCAVHRPHLCLSIVQRVTNTSGASRSHVPPPRTRKFDEDEYHSLVAELELPAGNSTGVLTHTRHFTRLCLFCSTNVHVQCTHLCTKTSYCTNTSG